MPPMDPAHGALRLERLPYSIAAPLRLMEQGTSGMQRLHRLIHAYQHAIRFLAVCLLCDYLRHPRLRAPRGEEMLAGLQRPSLGHWVRVLRDIPLLFAQQGVGLFLHEWPGCLESLTRVTYAQCLSLDYAAPRIPLPPLDAFLALRNVLAHGAAPPDDAVASQLYTHYQALLTAFLRQMPFLQDVALYRRTHQRRDEVRAVLLHGAHGPFAEVRLQRQDCFPTPAHVPECFLGRRSDPAAWLGLSPFFSSLPAEGEAMRCADPLLAFDGWAKQRVYYLGATRKVESRTMYASVMAALFRRRSTRARAWTGTAAAIAQHTTETIGRYLGVQYCPDLYLERKHALAQVRAFIHGSPKVSGLLLVAESGTGKTSLLCHLASRWLHQPDAQVLPWLIACQHLPEGAQRREDTTQPGALGILGQALRTMTGGACDAHWASLLAHLATTLGQQGKQPMPRLVLMLDAVNEAADPFTLLQEIDAVVGLARRVAWLRCLITLRQGSYEALRARFAACGMRWPQHERAYMRVPDAEGTLSFTMPLPGFSARESIEAYERYQTKAREDPTIPACRTPYAALPTTLQHLLRHPLMLRLFMQTRNHTRASDNLSQQALLAAFHRQLTPDQARTALAIAHTCLTAGRTQFTREDLTSLVHAWHEGKDDSARLVRLDPLEQLVDVGVCRRIGDTGYVFCHQLYVEFLLYHDLGQRPMRPLEVLATIERLLTCPQAHVEEELGAYRMLLADMLTTPDSSLLSRIVALLPSDAFRQFFLPLAFALKRDENAVYQQLYAQIVAAQNVAIVQAGIEIYRTLCDRPCQLGLLQRLGAIAHDEKVQRIAQIHAVRPLILSNRLDEAAAQLQTLERWAQAHAEERLLLDVYAETGYLSFVIGNAPQAHAAYDQALEVLARLRAQLTEQESLVKRWEIVHGKGCAEHNSDANEACATSHAEALSITRQLSDGARTALTLVNLADAYWGCHRYGPPLRLFQEAIEASVHACYHDALDVAQIGRGIVLWSMGRYDQADASLRAGVTLARELDYAWDVAYGMLYQSNLEASRGKLTQAIRTNHAALQRAQALGAAYLTALAMVYLIWKYEVISPGALPNQDRLHHCLDLCARNDLRGVAVFASSLRLLNCVVNTAVADAQIEGETHTLLALLERTLPVKGPWELLGLQIAQTIKQRRPAIDIMDLEDCIDMVVESKVLSLEPEDREVFLSTRKAWKY